MNKYKVYYFLRLIVSTLFGASLGLLLLWLSPYATEVFDILVIAMGLLTTVFNIPSLLIAVKNIKNKGEWMNFLMALSSIFLGLLLMLLQSDFLLLLLGIYSVLLPLIRIMLVENHMVRLKRELPRFLTGVIMVTIFLLDAEATVLRFGAYIVFGCTALYLLCGLICAHIVFSEK